MNEEQQKERAETEELFEELGGRIEKRRKKILITSIVIAVLILTPVFAILTKSFFAVESVSVSGSSAYSEEELLACANIEKGDILFFVSSSRVERRILSEYPLLEKVNVKKIYPNSVVIETVDETPMLYFDTGSEEIGYAVVSHNQKTVGFCATKEQVEEQYGKLYYVRMPRVKVVAVGEKLGFFEAGDGNYIPELIEAYNQTKLVDLPVLFDLSSRFDIKLYCGTSAYPDGGSGAKYTILLGNKSDISQKMRFAEGIIDKLEPGFEGIVSVEDVKNGYARDTRV